MALSLDPATRVITIPQADLTLVTGTLFELDTDQFRKDVNDLLSSEPYIWMPDAFIHNTSVTVAGVTFARTLEFINSYSVAFENLPYSVRLAGSNNNIFDVENDILVQNLVQVIAQNSAGLVEVAGGAANAAEIAQAVWDDLSSKYSDLTTMGGVLNNIEAILEPLASILEKVAIVSSVTYADFILEFSEFNDPALQTLVELKLVEACLLHSPDAWGDLYTIIVKYTTADLLSLTPEGAPMALRNDDGDTIYSEVYRKWLRARNARRAAVT